MWSQSILGKLKSPATQILHKYTVNPFYCCFTIFIIVAIVVFWCRCVIKTYNVLLHLFYKHIICRYINSLNHTASLILPGVLHWCLSKAVTNLHIEAELLYSHCNDILKHWIVIIFDTSIPQKKNDYQRLSRCWNHLNPRFLHGSQIQITDLYAQIWQSLCLGR